MSIDDTQQDDTQQDTETKSPVSRRTLMKTAAGVGVAVAAVGMVGVAEASPEEHSVKTPTASSVNGPVVVHLSDLASGTIEVFTNSSRVQIQDHDLAARIARASQH